MSTSFIKKQTMRKLFPILLLFASLSLNAQNTMYFMERVPQNISYNPAFIPDLKFHIGLPIVSGIAGETYNSGFTYSELDDFLNNLENENYNPDDFINSIGDKNTFYTEARANILSFGFRLKEKGYFTFDIKASNFIVNKAESEIIYLLTDYDDIPVEKFPIQIDEMDLLVNSSINMGATYSRVINENLTVGICPTLNLNNIGLATSDFSYIINRIESENEYTEYTYAEYDVTFTGKAVLGMPVEINPDAIDNGELDLNEDLFPEGWEDDVTVGNLLKNSTFSLDLGATYKLNKWMFSASLLNLGTSKWRNNAYELDGNEEALYVTEKSKVKIGLPTKIYLGAVRQFSPKWNYGFVFNNTFYSTGSNATATISLNGHLGSMLSTSISYTAGYKYDNLGLGLRLRFLPGTDLYFVTDNIIQLFNYENAYRVTAAFGINISIGTRIKAREKKHTEKQATINT